MNRRHFLELAAAGIFTPTASAIEPLNRPGKPRLLPALAAYSFRDSFAREPERIDMFRFVDFCADHGLAGAEVTSYYFPKDADDAWFRKLKHHAFLRGVALSGTAVGNNFALPAGPERDKEITSVKSWIEKAAVMGTSHIRVFAGAPPKGTAAADAIRGCIAALEECAAHAALHGIFLGVENHGGIVAEPEPLIEIVRSIKSPWVGINLDTGNFHTEDPYDSLAKCAPYAVNVQVKVDMRTKAGAASEADFARLASLLRAVNYQGFVALEYESREDPWAAVPKHLDRLKSACQG